MNSPLWEKRREQNAGDLADLRLCMLWWVAEGVMHTTKPLCFCDNVFYFPLNVWNIWFGFSFVSKGICFFFSIFSQHLNHSWMEELFAECFKSFQLAKPEQSSYLSSSFILCSLFRRKRELHPCMSMGWVFFGALVYDYLHCRLETLLIHCILCIHQRWNRRKYKCAHCNEMFPFCI